MCYVCSITFTLKKEGFGGGGSRTLQFKQAPNVGNFPTIKPSGKSCNITIQPGLPSSTRKFHSIFMYQCYSFTTVAPGFHSNSVRRPRHGTGASYLQQQHQKTNTGGRSGNQRSVCYHPPSHVTHHHYSGK